MFLYCRRTNDVVLVGKMAVPRDVRMRLHTHIQRAIVAACELEVTYKYSIQILGILCLSIDGDEDNELVVKVQKKWCKGTSFVYGGVASGGNAIHVASGGNAIHASCDTERLPSCCEPARQSVEGASKTIDCDIPELTDSYPRSFRPIPFSETSSQRNPLASISGVCLQGGVDSPKLYPLCSYDVHSDSHEMFHQRPGTVPLDNKASNVCADLPVVCDVRPITRVCNYKPISLPPLGNAPSATSTGIGAHNFTGFTRLCDATAEPRRRLFAPNEGQSSGGNGHRSVLSRKLFALTSFTDATLRGTSRGGRNGMGKVRKRTPVGGRWIKLPDRPGQRTMAQCFGITKNKRLTYSAEEQVELEHGGFARTMQRLLCRPPLRALNKDGFEVDVNGPTCQAAGPVSDVDVTGGDSMLENVQNINKVSLNQELELLVEHCHCMTAHGKLISGDCGLTVCDNVNECVDNITSAGPPGDPLCSSKTEIATTRSGMHHVTCVNNVSKYCAVADPAKTDKTSKFQYGCPCPKTTSDHMLLGSEVIRVKHSGIVESNTDNTVSSEATEACSVHFVGKVMSAAQEVDFDVVDDEHQVMSVSDSGSDTEESVKGHETSCDMDKAAVPDTGCSQQPVMPSDIGVDSSVNLCKQCDTGVTETASGGVGPTSPDSQCGRCTNELANNTLRKPVKCFTVTDSMSTSGGTTNSNSMLCTTEEQTVETFEAKEKELSEIHHSNQIVPVRDGDNVGVAHHKLKIDEESILVCSHATDDGNPADDHNNVETLAGTLVTDCYRNAVRVDDVSEGSPLEPELYDKNRVISGVDHSIDSRGVSVSSVVRDTHTSTGGSCPRNIEIRAMSTVSHEHNLTPGKHVRNLFPESTACKDVAGRRETYRIATNGLFFKPNLPAVETRGAYAGSLSGNETETKVGHLDDDVSSSLGTETELPLEAVNESQNACVPCHVVSVEMAALGDDSFHTFHEGDVAHILNQPEVLIQRPLGHDEHSPQCCAVEVTRLARPNSLFHSVNSSARVSGAFLVSPLIRPPIRVTNDGSSRIHQDEKRVDSLLMAAQVSVTDHRELPDHKEARVCQPDGLLMRERPVHSELERFVLRNLTSPDRDCVNLRGRIQTKSSDPDYCNSDVSDTAVSTHTSVGSEGFHMHDNDIGGSQLEAVCHPRDPSDTDPTDAVPHQCPSSSDATEPLRHVTNRFSASVVTCSDAASDRVNVTGSWTVVTDPLVTFPASSVAAVSRPLVTVTSFRNIQFSNVMFGSTEDKTVVSEAAFSPCSVKENRGDGLLQKLRRPLMPKTRDDRWKWPASLLRTISRRSRAVSRRRLKTASDTVYSVGRTKVKGRWSRKWRPGADSP